MSVYNRLPNSRSVKFVCLSIFLCNIGVTSILNNPVRMRDLF